MYIIPHQDQTRPSAVLFHNLPHTVAHIAQYPPVNGRPRPARVNKIKVIETRHQPRLPDRRCTQLARHAPHSGGRRDLVRIAEHREHGHRSAGGRQTVGGRRGSVSGAVATAILFSAVVVVLEFACESEWGGSVILELIALAGLNRECNL